MMKSTYSENDVMVLLKDVSGLVTPLNTLEREKKIQSGMHYCEMLPVEYRPTAEYMRIYHESMEKHLEMTAEAVGILSEKIWRKKGKSVVLVSLARAGIPIGILVKRYLQKKYNTTVSHYAISIIRGKGIDKVAMAYLLERHLPEHIQFVDGWTGKGTIFNELKKAMSDYENVSTELAAASDPAWITDLCGSHEDFLIPSSCLNATISGLLSRTYLNKNHIGEKDFHGALFYSELAQEDVSLEFIDAVERKMDFKTAYDDTIYGNVMETSSMESGLNEATQIAEEFGIKDINFVKPGIGETTRVLLRRIPWKILVKDFDDIQNIGHILRLAQEKNVEVIEYPLSVYRACGLITDLSSDL